MRINSNGNSQPLDMDQPVQETSAASDVQAAEQTQSNDSSAELENMRDPKWSQKDAGQIAEHELSGSLMAAQLNSQLAADKNGNSGIETTSPKPKSLPEILNDPNTSFEQKLAQSLYTVGSVAVDDLQKGYSAAWDLLTKKKTE
jgi:hypothetical protein